MEGLIGDFIGRKNTINPIIKYQLVENKLVLRNSIQRGNNMHFKRHCSLPSPLGRGGVDSKRDALQLISSLFLSHTLSVYE